MPKYFCDSQKKKKKRNFFFDICLKTAFFICFVSVLCCCFTCFQDTFWRKSLLDVDLTKKKNADLIFDLAGDNLGGLIAGN